VQFIVKNTGTNSGSIFCFFGKLTSTQTPLWFQPTHTGL